MGPPEIRAPLGVEVFLLLLLRRLLHELSSSGIFEVVFSCVSKCAAASFIWMRSLNQCSADVAEKSSERGWQANMTSFWFYNISSNDFWVFDQKKEGFLQWLQKRLHISVYIVLIALQTLLSNTLVLPPVLTAGRHRWLKCSEDRLQECDWNHGQALNNSGYWRWSIRCSSSKRKLSNSVAVFHLWKGQPPT